MSQSEAYNLVTSAVPTCRSDETAGAVLIYLQSAVASFESIDYVYVLENKKLVGVFSIHELISAPSDKLVADLMIKEVAFAHIHTDKAHLAEIALAESIKAVPVVDDEDNFIGVVEADIIYEILSEAHTNYLFKHAGIRRLSKKHTELSSVQQMKVRIPWLILGLFGGLFGAMIINSFEEAISHHVFIAAFIPAIVYIADAVGNQTEMLVVRALGREKNFSIRKYLLQEWSVGLLVSALLAIIMCGLSYAWLEDAALSLALTISIVATTIFSITFTVVLPWLLKRLGFDPAVASGPIATVVCDVSSVTIYLAIASTLI